MVVWISIIILAVVFPWVQQLGSWFLFLGLIISGLLLAEGLIGHWSLRDERQSQRSFYPMTHKLEPEKLTCDSRIFNEMGIKYETSLKHRSDSHINQSLTYQRGRIKVNGRGNRL